MRNWGLHVRDAHRGPAVWGNRVTASKVKEAFLFGHSMSLLLRGTSGLCKQHFPQAGMMAQGSLGDKCLPLGVKLTAGKGCLRHHKTPSPRVLEAHVARKHAA
jgi:hypothetical protein